MTVICKQLCDVSSSTNLAGAMALAAIDTVWVSSGFHMSSFLKQIVSFFQNEFNNKHIR